MKKIKILAFGCSHSLPVAELIKPKLRDILAD